MSNQIPQYQNLSNIPIGCTFCGASVQGKINQTQNPKTKEIVKECRWVCARCNNLVKIGNVK